MSIFKDSAFVLKIQKGPDKNFIYTIFSLKFGKIITTKKFSNKEKTIDLGFHINYEIKTGTKINKISNIKIINEFSPLEKNFSTINSYLFLLKTIIEKVPFGIEHYEIFEIINEINKYSKKDLEEKIILLNLKIIDILGELDLKNKNSIIEKILIFINKNNYRKIFKLTGINNEIKKELQNIL